MYDRYNKASKMVGWYLYLNASSRSLSTRIEKLNRELLFCNFRFYV